MSKKQGENKGFKEQQWRPGQSGNPKGRPKGSLNLTTLIEKVWNEEITDAEGNKKIQGLLAVKALIEKAKKGDVSAFKEIADRLEGRAKEKKEMTHTFKEMPSIIIGDEEARFNIGNK